MPQVVQIQRQPSSWEQGGQSIQQTADNFLKSMLSMGQMQNNNAWRMAEMNMQNQRLADANARQDKQLAAVDARSKEELAQRLQFHNDTMALSRAQFGLHQQALSEKNYERDLLRKLLDGTNPSAQDNTGLNAAVNEVLSPNWSPTSGGGQQDFGSMYDNGVRAGLLKPLPSMSGVGGGVDTPSPVVPIPTQAEVQLPQVTLDAPSLNYDPTKNTPLSQRPMLEVAKLTGLFPQFSDSPTATQTETTQQAPQPSMAAPAQAQLPADSGRLPMPSLPEKASIVLQGVPVTVDTFPTAFLAIPAGQRIFDSLKAKQEMLNHQYDLEMKAYKENAEQSPSLPFNKEIGKKMAQHYMDLNDQAGMAETALGNASLAQQAVDTGIYTGPGGEIIHTGRRAAGAVGLEAPQIVAAGETLKRIQNEMALMIRNPNSGLGMPGATSDKDINFLLSQTPGLDRSPEGNRIMIEMYSRVQRRKIELAQMANKYVQQHGTLDNGFLSEVRRYGQTKPIFEGMQGFGSSATGSGSSGGGTSAQLPAGFRLVN